MPARLTEEVKAQRAAEAAAKKEARESKRAAKEAEKEEAAKTKANAKAAEKATKTSEPRTRKANTPPLSEEERKAHKKESYLANKDKYNKNRLLARHSTGESTHFNRSAVVKYEIPIDGHVIKDLFDDSKVTSVQVRGGARDPVFNHIPNPAEPVIEPGKPLSYVELLAYLSATPEGKKKMSKTKCFFEVVVGSKFGEIKNIYPVINDTKLVEMRLQANVEPNGKKWTITTLRGYYATALWLTSHPKEVSVHLITNEAKSFYLAKINKNGELGRAIKARTEAITTDPAFAVYQWEMIVKRMRDVYGESSPFVLYLRIFEDMAARNDLGAVRIVDYVKQAKVGGNYLIKHDPLKKDALSPYIALMAFKTGKIYGGSRGELMPKTQKIILDSIEKQPRVYLFCKPGTNNQPWSADISAAMTGALQQAGLKMNSRGLRNAFVTYKRPSCKSYEEYVELARKLNHSVDTQPDYMRLLKPAISSRTSNLLDAHLEANEGEDTGEVTSKKRKPVLNPKAPPFNPPPAAQSKKAAKQPAGSNSRFYDFMF